MKYLFSHNLHNLNFILIDHLVSKKKLNIKVCILFHVQTLGYFLQKFISSS